MCPKDKVGAAPLLCLPEEECPSVHHSDDPWYLLLLGAWGELARAILLAALGAGQLGPRVSG